MKNCSKPHQRLTARVLLFLTIALVPLGIIGMIQNQRLNAEIEKRSELTLLALTEHAATEEKQAIQRIFGAARVLDGTLEFIRDDTEACNNEVGRYVNARSQFTYVGFIGMDGIITCSSSEQIFDFSEDAMFQDLVKNPRRILEVRSDDGIFDEPTVIFERPHIVDQNVEGFLTITLPVSAIAQENPEGDEDTIVSVLTFNSNGEILTTDGVRRHVSEILPRDRALANFAVGDQSVSFKALSGGGETLDYSVIPIVPGVAYALGTWKNSEARDGISVTPFLSTLLPFLMWLASLFVAWFVIDRFVVRRIKQLNVAMQDFAASRKLPAQSPAEFRWSELAEISELQDVFHQMATDIVSDETRQKERLKEKTILLKEVHHRVKNNLQIISSIMNMQIRKSVEPETKRALTQVQDRILGLSGVHRTLYQAKNLTKVDAGALIDQLIQQSRAIGSADGKAVRIESDLDPVVIFPDQAVPLTMLVSETLTNGMKYVGGDDPAMSVSLKMTGDEEATIVVENTCCGSFYDPENKMPSTGLGRQLIRAFVSQLNGKLKVDEKLEHYRVEVSFKVESFKNETPDF